MDSAISTAPLQDILRIERSKLHRPPAQQLLRLWNHSKTECYSNGGVVWLFSNPMIAILLFKLKAPHPLVTTLRNLSLLPPDSVADLAHLRFTVADIVPAVAQFRETRTQQDCHEWIVSLLYALEEVLRDVGDPREVRALKTFLEMKVSKHRICCNCGLRSKPRTDVEVVLSLPVVHPVSGQPLLNLAECLHHYLDKESVSYDCEQCGCKDSLQFSSVAYEPPVLLLQLRRFGNDLSKVGHTVGFPVTLRLSPKSEPYLLTGILLHTGLTLTSGHYSCIVRCCQSGRYFLTSDNAPPLLLHHSELANYCEDTYMLVYSNRELTLEYTAPSLQGDLLASTPKRPDTFTSGQKQKVQKTGYNPPSHSSEGRTALPREQAMDVCERPGEGGGTVGGKAALTKTQTGTGIRSSGCPGCAAQVDGHICQEDSAPGRQEERGQIGEVPGQGAAGGKAVPTPTQTGGSDTRSSGCPGCAAQVNGHLCQEDKRKKDRKQYQVLGHPRHRRCKEMEVVQMPDSLVVVVAD